MLNGPFLSFTVIQYVPCKISEVNNSLSQQIICQLYLNYVEPEKLIVFYAN